MGFLVESEPLAWEDALSKLKYVRDHGVEQFINVFFETKHISEDLLKYGDEVEYQLVKLEGREGDPNRRPKISLRSPEVVQSLHLLEAHGRSHGLSEADMCSWMPEYGRWMLEGTPGKPFEGITALTKVEDSMRLRRSRLLAQLQPDEIAPTLVSFPLLGVGEFWKSPNPHEKLNVDGPVAESAFCPDEITFPHQRFKTLTANIRKRRGEKVRIERPLFIDENTDASLARGGAPGPSGKIHADAMCFGMGCSALQVTFQAANLGESRHLYDHLAVLTPIMMALTAACPYIRGWLQAEDVRWSIVGESVDDRTAAERSRMNLVDSTGEEGDARLAGNGVKCLRKSRYAGIDCYISAYTETHGGRKQAVSSRSYGSSVPDREFAFSFSNDDAGNSIALSAGLQSAGSCNSTKEREQSNKKAVSSASKRARPLMARRQADRYNDIPIEFEPYHLDRLVLGGIDRVLARHVAHLFCRDPLVIFADRVLLNDRLDVDHWENLQSTNWQSVRWKPPPPERGRLEVSSEKHVGWRVELRSMELQMTDFENAAFTVFVVLISRVLLTLELNLYIPISKLEENMRMAHRMNAVTKGKFWFRKRLLPPQVRQQMTKKCQNRKNGHFSPFARGNGAAKTMGGQGRMASGAQEGRTPSTGAGRSPGEWRVRVEGDDEDSLGSLGSSSLQASGASPDESPSRKSFNLAGPYSPAGVSFGFVPGGNGTHPLGRPAGSDNSADEDGTVQDDTSEDDFEEDEESMYELMTIEEILMGKQCGQGNAGPPRGNGGAAAAASMGKNGPRTTTTGNNDTTSTSNSTSSAAARAASTGAKNVPASPGVESEDMYGSDQDFMQQSAAGNVYFPGLVPLCRMYMDFIGVDSVTSQKINNYLDFIVARASGKLQTNARWIRNFIRKHPSYKKDSRIPQDTAYDLLLTAARIGEGLEKCPDLLGDFAVDMCFPAANPFSRQFEDETEAVASWCSPPKYPASPADLLSRSRSGLATARAPEEGEPSMAQRMGLTQPVVRSAASSSNTPSSCGACPGVPCPPGATADSRDCRAAAHKYDLMTSYLTTAHARRHTVLRHQMGRKRREMKALETELAALQRDLQTSLMSEPNTLPRDLSAQRLVEASAQYSNRGSYRMVPSPSAARSRSSSTEVDELGG
ncbi:unnamed protein product [Amoebophrya sp. A25]|nr:unnamed protein product [Amoebophrya sp. A25]|eukprot:GSA25T00016013001.1